MCLFDKSEVLNHSHSRTHVYLSLCSSILITTQWNFHRNFIAIVFHFNSYSNPVCLKCSAHLMHNNKYKIVWRLSMLVHFSFARCVSVKQSRMKWIDRWCWSGSKIVCLFSNMYWKIWQYYWRILAWGLRKYTRVNHFNISHESIDVIYIWDTCWQTMDTITLCASVDD